MGVVHVPGAVQERLEPMLDNEVCNNIALSRRQSMQFTKWSVLSCKIKVAKDTSSK